MRGSAPTVAVQARVQELVRTGGGSHRAVSRCLFLQWLVAFCAQDMQDNEAPLLQCEGPGLPHYCSVCAGRLDWTRLPC